MKVALIVDLIPTLMQVRRMFTRADKDGDGKLTKEEWLSVLNSSGVPTTRWWCFFIYFWLLLFLLLLLNNCCFQNKWGANHKVIVFAHGVCQVLSQRRTSLLLWLMLFVIVFVDDQGRVTESSQTKRGVHPKMIVLLCRQACLDCSCCSYCSCCSCCCLRWFRVA